MMKKVIMIYLAVAFCITVISGSVYARTDFYIDGTIEAGNSFDNVYTWNDAVVDVTGGTITSFDMLNTSTVNLDGGNVTSGVYVWNGSELNMTDGSIGFSLEVEDSGIANLHGGLIEDYLYATDTSVVNIYGYGFNYDLDAGRWNGGQLTGYWLDDTPLAIDLLNNIAVDSTYYDHVNLIPEPATLLLLGLGSLALRKRR